ncbi:MAG: copper-binding protein [Alphaproteobacteria bacterium]|nr:copper-binding protein [Alphaproteobacteria bacterium]
MNMGGQAPAAAPAGVAPAAGVLKATGKGEVTRIDEATGRLGIRHEPIPELNMATGMNMLFRIADPAMLQQVKVGDQVTFEASREGAVVTILKLSKAP